MGDVTNRIGVIRFDRHHPGSVINNGFPNRASAWDVLAGQPDCMTDLQDYLKDIDENPDLRAAATLRSMSRLRAELEKVPETCGLGDPVVLRVQDVALLARQLLSRLR